ncbi:citrate synthase/methylcitrate synthase [Brevibacillus sp. WF146]|uniref:citrate synthase/methylcitrate synthase n=1 Tax=Brevibacillus sp. WF146 TaxID=319501 RepID=UPI0007ED9001|nr:citrate synthase/methylcitrate synthase [Brevibacillus sp. WF146]UYZ14780.1 citrate synthase/methylcitrate synthase [Brevibacillus sp. WF146]
MTVNEGLENVVVAKTAVSLVDAEKGNLVYRGFHARDLARDKSFEEVAYLLLHGNMPDVDERKDTLEKWASARELPASVRNVIDALSETHDLMSMLRTAVSALSIDSPEYPPTLQQATSVIIKLPVIIAYCYRRLKGLEPVAPRPDLGHTANYLYMLRGTEPSPVHVQALEAYLNLLMDHGMNSSTFTARVIASTRSDLVSAITGAIGALKGPLHGGAPSLVLDMLKDIGTKDNAEPWIKRRLESGGRLPGFGHRVYKTKDPRSEALRLIATELSGSDAWLDLAVHVEQTAQDLLAVYKPHQKLYTNVEYYAAAVMNAIGFEPELFTPTFALTRSVGWCAHIIEASQGRLVYPDSAYIGRLPSE